MLARDEGHSPGHVPAGTQAHQYERGIGTQEMTFFRQFNVFAASRNEGLHPKLQALLERAAASPFSEVSLRHDGLVQSGPSPNSEIVSSWTNVTPFPRELCRAVSSARRAR